MLTRLYLYMRGLKFGNRQERINRESGLPLVFNRQNEVLNAQHACTHTGAHSVQIQLMCVHLASIKAKRLLRIHKSSMNRLMFSLCECIGELIISTKTFIGQSVDRHVKRIANFDTYTHKG